MTRRAFPLLLLAGCLAASGGAAATPSSLALAIREASGGIGAAMPAAPVLGEDWERDDWDWVERAPAPVESAEVPPWKAVAASALLPGLGERLVGRDERSRLFWALEGAIWSAFGFYRIQADLRQDRQLEFAGTRAGAPYDQDRDYYEHIGLWLSLEEWHDIVRQDARLRFPDDPAAQQAFFEANKRYDAGQAWSWEDDATRTRYRQLRSKAERSYRNARLAAGAALFNRFASMIDALAVSRAHNRRLREEHSRLDLRIAPTLTADGLVVGPVVTTRY
jgi:hypothetical protein